MEHEPAYLSLLQSGELERRAATAAQRLAACDLCPWVCKKDRAAGGLGVCGVGARARVASYGPHPGEEAALSGWRGSGTIFFSGCSLRCQYCQNADISTDPGAGAELDPEALAEVMLALQRMGCHNINLVTPSHVVPQILAAVRIAAQAGLRLPLVYNTSGWDALSTLALLDGVVDIYMPDMKYSSPQAGLRYSKVRDYPRINREAVRAMHRQVGDLQISADGLAWRGLLVRHLVLPNGLAGTGEVVRFLAEEISPHTALNLMDQYRPAYNARQYQQVNRPITAAEYAGALQFAREAGLTIL